MKTKKITLVTLLFITVIMVLGSLSISNAVTTTAETDELGYLKITRNRTIARTVEPGTSDTVTYRHQIYKGTVNETRNVWKLVTCDVNNTTNKVTETNEIPDLYCLRAGLGFTASDVEEKAVYYKNSIDMTDYAALVKQFKGVNSDVTLFDEENIRDYYAVLWILDNMLLENASDEELAKYLVKYTGLVNDKGEKTPGYTQTQIENAFKNKTPDILTRADIEAIQQLAIWYFTNSDEAAYHVNSLPTLYLSIDGDAIYYTVNEGEENDNHLGIDSEGNYVYKSMTDIYNVTEGYGSVRQARARELFKNLISDMNEAVKNGTYRAKNRDMIVWLAGTDFAKEQPVVQVKEKVKNPDIALRKFISKIDGEPLGISREPKVYAYTEKAPYFNRIDPKTGELQTTAKYEHSKEPVSVEIGNEVTYTLRLYNEGNIDAIITEVTDHLPRYLTADAVSAADLGWALVYDNTTKSYTATTKNCKIVGSSENLKDSIGSELQDVIIPAAVYNSDKKDYTLSYVDIEITFTVDADAPENINLTNIAEVTGMTDTEGNLLLDRDSGIEGSENGGVADIPTDPNTDPSKNVTIDPAYPGGEDPDKTDLYVPGQEDDDDFEKVYIKPKNLDLALRKFITAINGEELPDDEKRVPIHDVKGFNGSTTAIYNHTKEPRKVHVGDIVTYTIRLYNEGQIDGKVKEVTDYIAKYLKYVPSADEKASKNWWTPDYTGKDYYTLTTTEDCIVVGVGGNTSEEYKNGKLADAIIPAYDKQTKTLSYVDIRVNCEVQPVTVKTYMTNIAEITKQAQMIPALDETGNPVLDEEGNPVYQEEIVSKDIDSTPDNVSVPVEKLLQDYKGGKDTNPDDNYVPGQEDDDDFEKVYVEPFFDLALRKFITGVNNVSINNRYPEVSYVDGNFKYNHTKEPVPVATKDIVTYTIRIYNEGQADGYANEITDDVPEGIEFLPDNDINKEYRWKMLDKDQKPTNDVSKAKYIVTDYLSEAQEEATGRDNKLRAFNLNGDVTDKTEVTNANPDYRDIKVAFKVTYVPTTKEEAKRIIINEAQISADSDDDIDSVPNRDEKYDYDPDGKNEDDIDYDNIIVKYFDLALLKWVSETHVTLDGKTTIYDAGNSEANAHNENIPQLVLNTSDIGRVTVKYLYTIKVMNEGELDGYATEIKDHIPKGLRFDKEDAVNKKYGWKETADGQVTTDYLKDTLLEAGKDKNVTVQIMFTWINSKENLGSKVNYAEISEDDNPGDVPDIDSTPDNLKEHPDGRPTEDDEDDAEVIITIKTGSAQLYLGLTATLLLIFGAGITLIKKYVL